MKYVLVLQCLCLMTVLASAGPPLGSISEENLSKNCQTPKCPQNNPASDKPVTLPYPLDCLQYIRCEGSEAQVLACPGDLVFNKNTGACDTRANANCVPCWQQA